MALKRGEWLRPDESSSSEEADKLHVFTNKFIYTNDWF
jgi:hypothetical protein